MSVVIIGKGIASLTEAFAITRKDPNAFVYVVAPNSGAPSNSAIAGQLVREKVDIPSTSDKPNLSDLREAIDELDKQILDSLFNAEREGFELKGTDNLNKLQQNAFDAFWEVIEEKGIATNTEIQIQIAQLLAKRFSVVEKVAKFKAFHGVQALQEKRFESVLANLAMHSKTKNYQIDEATIRALWDALHDVAIQYEHSVINGVCFR